MTNLSLISATWIADGKTIRPKLTKPIDTFNIGYHTPYDEYEHEQIIGRHTYPCDEHMKGEYKAEQLQEVWQYFDFDLREWKNTIAHENNLAWSDFRDFFRETRIYITIKQPERVEENPIDFDPAIYAEENTPIYYNNYGASVWVSGFIRGYEHIASEVTALQDRIRELEQQLKNLTT